jgi:hypothetical protein
VSHIIFFWGVNYEIFDLIKLFKYLIACDFHPNYDGDKYMHEMINICAYNNVNEGKHLHVTHSPPTKSFISTYVILKQILCKIK